MNGHRHLGRTKNPGTKANEEIAFGCERSGNRHLVVGFLFDRPLGLNIDRSEEPSRGVRGGNGQARLMAEQNSVMPAVGEDAEFPGHVGVDIFKAIDGANRLKWAVTSAGARRGG